jgi:hypothetical protein
MLLLTQGSMDTAINEKDHNFRKGISMDEYVKERFKKFCWHEVPSPIRNAVDVEVYFCHLQDDRKINFHPDDDMKDVVNYETGEKVFEDLEADWHNYLMHTCHAVCALEEVDIYGIACDLVHIRDGFKKAKGMLGKMVIAKDVVDYHPHVYVPKGGLGKVVKADDDFIHVELVEHDSALDEWDNCVVYYDEVFNQNPTDFLREWELTDIYAYTYAITVVGEGEVSDDEKPERLCESLEQVKQFVDKWEFVGSSSDTEKPPLEYTWQPEGYDDVDLAIAFKDESAYHFTIERIPLDKEGAIMNNGVNPHMLEKAKCDRCGESDLFFRQTDEGDEYYRCNCCHFMLHADDYYSASSHGICPVCNESAPCKHHPMDGVPNEDVDWSQWLPTVMEMPKDKQDMVLGLVADLMHERHPLRKIHIERAVFEESCGILVGDSSVTTKFLGDMDFMKDLYNLMEIGIRRGWLYGYDTQCD